MPGMLLGQVVPDFKAETNEGPISFHEWLATPLPGQANSWTVMFSHPADFTPVCTTELAGVEKLAPEFHKRNVKLIALSCDDAEAHRGFIQDIKVPLFCNHRMCAPSPKKWKQMSKTYHVAFVSNNWHNAHLI